VLIRRIAIAVDASPTSIAALEATVELAAVWEAEVLGIFVEDVNLIKAASLPFAGEVGSHSGAFRRIDPDNVRRQRRCGTVSPPHSESSAGGSAKSCWRRCPSPIC